MRLLLLVMLLNHVTTLYGQGDYRASKSKEISITYDNDILFITDQYYTSGFDIFYAKVEKSTGFISRLFNAKDSEKVLKRFNYGHKIFTPQKIREPDLSKRDRPYAGWHYLGFQLNHFQKPTRSNQFQITLGLVGPFSGIGNFQRWYHEVSGITSPLGWESEIANEVVLDLSYSKFYTMRVSRSFDVISETNLTVGNGELGAYQQLTMRAGKFNSINNSGFLRSRLSTTELDNPKNREEGFAFLGVQGQYIHHNIFIEGSLFNDKSEHTEKAEQFVIVQSLGGLYSTTCSTFKVTFYRLSREVVGGRAHRYVSFELALRF